MEKMVFNFDTASIRKNIWGKKVSRILNAALMAVEPSSALLHYVNRSGNLLKISDRQLNLDEFKNVYIINVKCIISLIIIFL